MTETWDVNEQVKADWKADTTPFERVYGIVEQTHDGQLVLCGRRCPISARIWEADSAGVGDSSISYLNSS